MKNKGRRKRIHQPHQFPRVMQTPTLKTKRLRVKSALENKSSPVHFSPPPPPSLVLLLVFISPSLSCSVSLSLSVGPHTNGGV